MYCVVGDGESQEGQVWEAAMSAPKLGRPTGPSTTSCADRRLQRDPARRLRQEHPRPRARWSTKWKAFGWAVLAIDGHDLAQIDKALDEAEPRGGPTLIVAHTVKGKGVSFMENDPEWHGKAPKPAEAIAGIREVLGGHVPAWA